jgi:hypothetical protein
LIMTREKTGSEILDVKNLKITCPENQVGPSVLSIRTFLKLGLCHHHRGPPGPELPTGNKDGL